MADHRWHSYQKTLPFHVYDHDGGGTTTVDFSTEIKVTKGTTVNINSEYEVSEKRDNVGRIFFDRDVFLNQNIDSGINGIKNGYRIYGFNNFKATTPHQIINLN